VRPAAGAIKETPHWGQKQDLLLKLYSTFMGATGVPDPAGRIIIKQIDNHARRSVVRLVQLQSGGVDLGAATTKRLTALVLARGLPAHSFATRQPRLRWQKPGGTMKSKQELLAEIREDEKQRRRAMLPAAIIIGLVLGILLILLG